MKSVEGQASGGLATARDLYHQGRLDAALSACQDAMATRPDDPGVLQMMAVIAHARGDLPESAGWLRTALDSRPASADLHYNLATVLAGQDAHEEAVDEFRQALSLKPHDAAALNNLGNSLLALGRLREAEAAFARALGYDRKNETIKANRAGVLNRIAVGLRNQGGESEAEPLLREALQLRPESPEVWNNLAVVLHDRGNLAAGEAAARRALELLPDYASALNNLGNILIDAGREQEAMASYEAAVRSNPDAPSAHWNLALACLSLGDLPRGFAAYEWRMSLPEARGLYVERAYPLWKGEDLAGRRILLFAEQGLGDTLQFVRYAPLVAALGAEVWVECQPPLKSLLAGVSGITGVVAADEDPGKMDFVCPLMSLPNRFGTSLDSIPDQIPYIQADPVRQSDWGRRFRGKRMPRAGLVWAGEPRKGQADAHRIDRRRSIELALLEPLLAVEGVEFYSLQKGAAAAQLAAGPCRDRIVDWSGDFTDFSETAALIANLDLVVGVDTSVIHLAGAMARPVWVFSRYDGCWRWLRSRDDSPWYPTLRLFRQERPLEWGPAIRRAAEALVAWRDRFVA